MKEITEVPKQNSLRIESISFKKGEKQISKEVVNRGDSVAALLFNSSTEKYILIKQFRAGAGKKLIEIIAGTMDVDGENKDECLKREIAEETGYLMTACNLISCSYVSPGYSTEKMHIYQALTDGSKSGEGIPEDGIEILEYSMTELCDQFGVLSEDLKTHVALVYELEYGPIIL